MLFKNNDGSKIRKYYINIHKAMIIPVGIYRMNKTFFVTVQPKNARKLEFSDHLWIPFLDQPQSDIVFFVIITFQSYNILVHKQKHRLGPDDITSLNEELELSLASIIELFNIHESSHEEAIVTFIANKD